MKYPGGWVGGYVAIVNVTANWTLPLTYPNGGKTSLGMTLIIQNQGPNNITLYTTSPETIQGSGSYFIAADSTVSILSAQDWVVVSNTFGTTSQDGNFGYLQAQNESVQCWLGVGTTSPINQSCGDLTSTRLFVGSVSGTTYSGDSQFLRSDNVSLSGLKSLVLMSAEQFASSQGTVLRVESRLYQGGPGAAPVIECFNSVPGGVATFTSQIYGIFVVGLRLRFDMTVTDTSTIVASQITGVELRAGVSGSFNTIFGSIIRGLQNSGTIQDLTVTSVTGLDVRGTANGINAAVGTVYGIDVNAGIGLVNVTTRVAGIHAVGVAVSNGVPTNSIIQIDTPPSGGTSNYAIWINSNISASSAGWCSGTVGDTCMWRAAANRWTFNTGTALSVPGYVNLGSGSAPSNTANGAFTTTISSPGTQAFGAITANAASGILTFTVTNSALTCATAVVTNSNVVAVSEVMLTIQSYTGTQYTNGIPRVFRSDGSTVGSFIVTLCNDHATNALSGTLKIAFWVLN